MNIILSNYFESDTLIFFTALLCIFIIYGILRSKWLALALCITAMLLVSFLFIYSYITEQTFAIALVVLALFSIVIILSKSNTIPYDLF